MSQSSLSLPVSPYWADRAGIWASAACVVHCLLTPVLLSSSSVLAHLLPSEEWTHRTLALAIAMIGTFALIRGFRKHRRMQVLSLMISGFALIASAALFGDRLPAHWVEVAVTAMGSLMMICSHRLNHTFCRQCSCAHGARPKAVENDDTSRKREVS